MQELEAFYADTGPERVGFVLKDGSVVECGNVHPEPEESFAVSDIDLIQYEDDMAASWHTHPGKSANLSGEDFKAFLQWPHIEHCIVGNDGVRKYKVVRGILVNAD